MTIINPYDTTGIRRSNTRQYDDETQQVARWARDIRQQQPDITQGEAIRIAEKWLIESRKS